MKTFALAFSAALLSASAYGETLHCFATTPDSTPSEVDFFDLQAPASEDDFVTHEIGQYGGKNYAVVYYKMSFSGTSRLFLGIAKDGAQGPTMLSFTGLNQGGSTYLAYNSKPDASADELALLTVLCDVK